MSDIVLHGYWRSGTSYRARIALNLKGVAYEQASIDLRLNDQGGERYRALNPQGLVPALEVDGTVLTQSPAILEWLEERHPDPPLLPRAATDRATVRAMAATIGCDIHPLNNLRVLKALRGEFAANDDAINGWADRWITAGFDALELMVERHGRGFAWGDAPGLVECYLVPQAYSAERFGVDVARWPRLAAAVARANEVPAIAAAHPALQPDADG